VKNSKEKLFDECVNEKKMVKTKYNRWKIRINSEKQDLFGGNTRKITESSKNKYLP